MKAIRIHEPTGISGLVYEEAPDPTLVFGDVLVKVAACGITHNELDYPIWTCRAGHQRTSIIPGAEVSGVIAALGLGTAGVAVGEEVFGLTDQLRDGTAAEYVAVEARNLAPKPRTADHVHAAAVPRAGLTAWQALFDHGKLANGHASSFTQPVERVVEGVLDQRWAAWFGGLHIDSDGTQTVISGLVTDQPALHGLLAKICGLGLCLICVHRLNSDQAANRARPLDTRPSGH